MNIEDIATFCKAKGFVYPSSEIYGGLAGFWDFGPLGVELFNNIKQHWWKHFVQNQENMVGLDASIVSHPKIWKASGHVDNFGDLVLTCSKCKHKLRADHFIEDKLQKNVEGLSAAEINKIIQDNKLTCPECKGDFQELKSFNLLFKTLVGADEETDREAYLRGETAQGMFTNFKLVADTARVKLPFGIAQVGKCFRNEIAPRDFVFRSREFTIAEFEFFVHPKKDDATLSKEQQQLKLMFLDADAQNTNKSDLAESSIQALVKAKKLGNWHAYWLAEQLQWIYTIGLQ